MGMGNSRLALDQMDGSDRLEMDRDEIIKKK